MSARLQADRGQIAQFVEVLLRYADEGGFVSLRSFTHENKALEPRAVQINGEGLGPVVGLATGEATRAANDPRRVVFCPPICTFKAAKGTGFLRFLRFLR